MRRRGIKNFENGKREEEHHYCVREWGGGSKSEGRGRGKRGKKGGGALLLCREVRRGR